MSAIEENFQVIYVPEWEKIGHFKNFTNLFDQEEELKLHIISCDIDASNGQGIFPIVYATVSPGINTSDMRNGEASRLLVCVPESNIGEICGRTVVTSGPTWVQISTMSGTKVIETKSDPKKIEQPSAAGQEPKLALKYLVECDVRVEELLKTWGMCEYKRQALVGSIATLTIPLNFSVEIGKRYKVSGDSGPLFAGILYSARHIVSTEGSNPQAYTILTFRWITCGNFKLPGADEK